MTSWEIVTCWLGLPYYVQVRVARDLGLYDDGDQDLPDQVWHVLVCSRVREHGKLDAFAEAVTEARGA